MERKSQPRPPVERKQRLEIHLDAPLLKWLRAEARNRGVSLGELIRSALRNMMERDQRR